jgi:hypothetical protein
MTLNHTNTFNVRVCTERWRLVSLISQKVFVYFLLHEHQLLCDCAFKLEQLQSRAALKKRVKVVQVNGQPAEIKFQISSPDGSHYHAITL